MLELQMPLALGRIFSLLSFELTKESKMYLGFNPGFPTILCREALLYSRYHFLVFLSLYSSVQHLSRYIA